MKVRSVTYPYGGTMGDVEASAGGKRMFVYLTSAFRPAASVNVIVYLHGHWRTKTVKNFDQLIQHETIASFIRAVDGAGAPLALVIPSLGVRSGEDWVSEKDAFASVLKDVQQFAAWRANELKVNMCLKDWTVDPASGQKVQPLLLGTLVLAAHSGGGATLNRLRKNGGSNFANVKEVWMFDSLYGGSGEPEEWIPVAEQTVIHAFWEDTWRTEKLEKLRKQHKNLPNLKTVARTPGHDHIPGRYAGKLIQNSANL
ncbi:MAG: hypothetical protein JNL98_32570 [Bryobacterales bacterium]|nr:hypothetical protein [Bryobacterales bacterium]